MVTIVKFIILILRLVGVYIFIYNSFNVLFLVRMNIVIYFIANITLWNYFLEFDVFQCHLIWRAGFDFLETNCIMMSRTVNREKQAPVMFHIKKVFLKISRNSQENTCARFSFLIKLQERLFYRAPAGDSFESFHMKLWQCVLS